MIVSYNRAKLTSQIPEALLSKLRNTPPRILYSNVTYLIVFSRRSLLRLHQLNPLFHLSPGGLSPIGRI